MIERVRCHNFGGSSRFITIYSGKSNKLSNLSNVALQSLKYMSIDSCRGDKFLLGQICAVAWQICVNCDWCNQYCSQSRTVRGRTNRRIHSCKCPALSTIHPLEPSKAFWLNEEFHQCAFFSSSMGWDGMGWDRLRALVFTLVSYFSSKRFIRPFEMNFQ